jgi:hypothetical protein
MKKMKKRIVLTFLTAALLFSFFALTLVNADVVSTSTIRKKGVIGGAFSQYPPVTAVTGTFHNDGTVDVTAAVTAQVKKSNTEVYTNTTTVTFPAGQDTTVMLTVQGIQYEPYLACLMDVASTGTSSGTGSTGSNGSTPAGTPNPQSGGKSVVSGSSQGGFNFEAATGPIIGVVVVGAVAVTSFFVVKKRRVTEQSLRRLSSFEFQDWVVKRVFANPSSQKDAYLGIDAYTAEGYPVQIRQDDDVGKRAIDSFAAAMARNKQRTGTIIAFGFGNDAAEGVMKARLNYRLEIRTVTVKELLAGKGRTY